MSQPDQFHTLTASELAIYWWCEKRLELLDRKVDSREIQHIMEELSDIELAAVKRVGCFVLCNVRSEQSAYLVTFSRWAGDPPERFASDDIENMSILLQTDYYQASFADACGLIHGPEGEDPVRWDEWTDCDLTDIWYCPDHYLDAAEYEPPDTYDDYAD